MTRFVAWSLTLAALGTLGTAMPALAMSVSVEVQVIYATNTPAPADPHMTPPPKGFSSFRYSAYKRIDGRTMSLSDTSTASMDLPGGRRLDVFPRTITADSADLRVAIYERGTKLVVSLVRLAPGGQPIIVGGFKHQDGALFLSIKALPPGTK